MRTLDPRKWDFQWPGWWHSKAAERLRNHAGRLEHFVDTKVGDPDGIEAAERALAFSGRRVGRDNPLTVDQMQGLASKLLGVGRTDEAVALRRDALARCTEAVGPSHLRTLQAGVFLAKTLETSEQYVEASEVFFEAIKANRRGTPEEDICFFRTNVEFGMLCSRMGLHDVARKALLTGAEGLSEVLGPLDPQTLTAEGWLARALTREGNLDEALRIRRHVVDGFGQTLGPEHPDTQKSMWSLVDLLHLRGENAEAAVVARSVLDWMTGTGRADDDEATRVRELIAAIDGTATTG